MKWVGHVARMGKGEVYTEFWWGNLRVRDHLANAGVDGKIIFGFFVQPNVTLTAVG